MKSNDTQKRSRDHVTVVRRPPSSGQQKVTPIVNEESNETKPSIQARRTLPSFASRKGPSHSDATICLSTITTDDGTKIREATSALSEFSSNKPKPGNLSPAKESSGGIKRWYSALTSKQKMLLRAGILAAILVIGATVILLPVVFLVILRTSSSSSASIIISSKVISASWTFDLTTADSYGVYNGTMMNGANYSAASTTQPYLGNGRALTLSGANQSYIVAAPFFNLAYTSFTVETWIYPTVVTGDCGIFGQCACSTCSNQCIYLLLRGDHLYADFTLNNVPGSTTIATNTWYHVAFVYNYATKQQILYLNGVQDGISSNAQPYQGTNGSIQIGAAQVSSATSYFTGYIDNLKLTTRAKSSTEILYDASITAYYSFDLSSLNNDNGPNGLNGLSINTAVVNGRVNQAMSFSGSSSYFQAYGFYQFIYSISAQPFSISLWLSPSAVVSSAIIQVTQQQSTSSCFGFMGIVSPAGVTGQLMVEGYGWPIIYGPFLTVNTWTHVSVTYAAANGIRLYVNGVLFGATGSNSFSTSGWITWLQIGTNFGCNGYIPSGAYQGSIDEMYVHSRELTQADVTALDNP